MVNPVLPISLGRGGVLNPVFHQGDGSYGDVRQLVEHDVVGYSWHHSRAGYFARFHCDAKIFIHVDRAPAGVDLWTLTQGTRLQPVGLSPELRCPHCGIAGIYRDGQWEEVE